MRSRLIDVRIRGFADRLYGGLPTVPLPRRSVRGHSSDSPMSAGCLRAFLSKRCAGWASGRGRPLLLDEGDEARPVQVQALYYRTRWLTRRQAALERGIRARCACGVAVGHGDLQDAVSRWFPRAGMRW
jgi:hypothetical protein